MFCPINYWKANVRNPFADMTNILFFRSHEILFRFNELLFRLVFFFFFEILFRFNELLFRFFEI